MTESKLPAWCRQPGEEDLEGPEDRDVARKAKRGGITLEEAKRIQRERMRERGGYSGEFPRSTWELF